MFLVRPVDVEPVQFVVELQIWPAGEIVDQDGVAGARIAAFMSVNRSQIILVGSCCE
jgi:hypothetical protein